MTKILIIALVMFIAVPGVYAQTDNVTLVDIQEATKKIREKEKELQEKEQALNAREETLKVMEQDLISREDDLKKVRQEVSEQMNQLSTESNAELDQLAKIYSSTKAKSAAGILIKMEPDKSAAIIRRITPMNAGRIMAEIGKQDPDYASRLTGALTGDNTGSTALSLQLVP